MARCARREPTAETDNTVTEGVFGPDPPRKVHLCSNYQGKER